MAAATSTWRVRVLAEVEDVGYRLKSATTVDADAKAHAEILLGEARDAAARAGSIGSAWYGTNIDEAWIRVHEVEVMLIAHADPATSRHVIADVVARASNALKPDDARLVALKAAVAKTTPPDADTIALAATALGASYDASDADHRKVRDFRNVLIASSGVLALFAVLLGVVCALSPNVVNLCWSASPRDLCPTGHAHAGRLDVIATELLGVLSATIGAGLAVRGIRGTSTPYSVPLMTLLIKLPTGALTAVGGLLLTHLITGFAITSTAQLAAFALVFGASQQTFTRLIDKQAQSVLDAVPASGKDAAKPTT